MLDNDTAIRRMFSKPTTQAESKPEPFHYDCFIRTRIANYYAIKVEEMGFSYFVGTHALINNGVYPAVCQLDLNCEYIVEHRTGEIMVRTK